MAIDRGYGSGSKGTGRANNRKRQMSGAEKARAKGIREGSLGRRAGASPFNDMKGRAIGWDELAGVAATAGLAAGGMAVARTGAGRRAIKSVTPLSPRITAAAKRSVARSQATASNLENQRSRLIAEASSASERASALRSTEYVGADYFDSSSRQVDPLFDKWETTTYRRGSGPSAESQARARAAATGRTVRAQATQDYAGRAVRYRLDPTENQLRDANRLESEYVNRVGDAGKLASRASSASSRTTRQAAAEIRRRLASLRRAKEAAKKAPKKNDPKKPLDWGAL